MDQSLVGRKAANREGKVPPKEAAVELHLKRYFAEFDFRYNERIGIGLDETKDYPTD